MTAGTSPTTANDDGASVNLEVLMEPGTEPSELLGVALPMVALAGLFEGIEGPLASAFYANINSPSGAFILGMVGESLEAARRLYRAQRVSIAAVPVAEAEGGTDAAVV